MTTQNNSKKPVRRYENQFEAFRDVPKTTGKQIVETLNPLSPLFNNESSKTSSQEQLAKAQELQKKDHKHTPLDLQKLDSTYKNQDEAVHAQELARLQNTYLKRIHNDDEQMLLNKNKEQEEKERQEAYEEQLKKQQEQERIAKQNQEEPHGKAKRGIFGGKKKTDISREVQYENKGQRGR